MKLKEFFHESNYEQDDSLVRNKSDFTPPKGRNQALDDFINITKKIPTNPVAENRHNITHSERQALKSLQEDDNIIIKEADKGGGIVIMNKQYYKAKILSMLQDNSFYDETNNEACKQTFKKIQKVIGLAKDITRNEINYLLDFDCKTSTFYGLPKIHKSKLIKEKCLQSSSTYIEILDPEDLTFRPIVAGPCCETHRLSNLIDILLKPFIKEVQSYIRDDIDFLNYIPENVNKNTLLVSFDVTNLYSNISHNLGLEAINYWLDKHPQLIHRRFNKTFILEAIKVILENNNFTFNEKMYTQVKGTAMGTKFAPTYATLVLAYLEEALYKKSETEFGEEFGQKLRQLWKRFLDDCFMLWDMSRDHLNKFHIMLNNLHPDLNFTIEVNDKELPFLDILLTKEGTRLNTDIYFKPTDTKQYLNYKSCHPKHTINSIPYNLARRICTIVSNSEIKKQRLSELYEHLKSREYPKRIIEAGIREAMKIPKAVLRQVQRKQEEDKTPYVSTYNTKNPEMFGIFTNSLHILNSDPKMKDIVDSTKFIKSKRQLPNLKRLLTKAKYSDTQSQIYKVTKCGRSNCSLCQHITESESYNFNGKVFKVNSNMSCDVKNVLYVITCNGCKEYYIGQTGDKLRTRRTIHAQQIRDPTTRQIPLSAHLDECSNHEPKFQMFPFYKVRSEKASVRLSKENYFINCFKPKLNAIK